MKNSANKLVQGVRKVKPSTSPATTKLPVAPTSPAVIASAPSTASTNVKSAAAPAKKVTPPQAAIVTAGSVKSLAVWPD